MRPQGMVHRVTPSLAMQFFNTYHFLEEEDKNLRPACP